MKQLHCRKSGTKKSIAHVSTIFRHVWVREGSAFKLKVASVCGCQRVKRYVILCYFRFSRIRLF